MGYSFRFNPKLGYPGVMDNMYWPTFDFSGRLLLWIFGRITPSAELSYHLLYVFGVCLMTSGILFGFVKLGIRPWLAFVGACAFIATPFFASPGPRARFPVALLRCSFWRLALHASRIAGPRGDLCGFLQATEHVGMHLVRCHLRALLRLLHVLVHRAWRIDERVVAAPQPSPGDYGGHHSDYWAADGPNGIWWRYRRRFLG